MGTIFWHAQLYSRFCEQYCSTNFEQCMKCTKLNADGGHTNKQKHTHTHTHNAWDYGCFYSQSHAGSPTNNYISRQYMRCGHGQPCRHTRAQSVDQHTVFCTSYVKSCDLHRLIQPLGLLPLSSIWHLGHLALAFRGCTECCSTLGHWHPKVWPHHSSLAATTLVTSATTSRI